MESKSVKVIDEHNIDRVANIICSFDLDGSDYVIYWIERDAENANIFVSKLLKNIDGTSRMLNIDDSMEKAKVDELVKELIKNAIEKEEDKLSTNSVTLANGNNVSISSVLINQEQNINVHKTYITTVKKAVTKVSEEYYHVENKVVEEATLEVTPVKEEVNTIFPEVSEVVPQEELVVEEKTVEEPVLEESVKPLEVVPEVIIPKEEPVVSTIPNVVAPEIPIHPVTDEVVEKEEKKVEEVLPEVNASVKEEVLPKVNIVSGPVETPEPVTPVLEEPVKPVIPEPVATIPEVKPESLEPVPEPVAEIDNQLVFNAAKETNLNVALGEASNEASIPVVDVEPIREFGEDSPKIEETPVVNQPVETAEVENVKVLQRKKAGFANSKFFMFIAIAFFLASCVFLGYEAFKYFQLT